VIESTFLETVEDVLLMLTILEWQDTDLLLCSRPPGRRSLQTAGSGFLGHDNVSGWSRKIQNNNNNKIPVFGEATGSQTLKYPRRQLSPYYNKELIKIQLENHKTIICQTQINLKPHQADDATTLKQTTSGGVQSKSTAKSLDTVSRRDSTCRR